VEDSDNLTKREKVELSKLMRKPSAEQSSLLEGLNKKLEKAQSDLEARSSAYDAAKSSLDKYKDKKKQSQKKLDDLNAAFNDAERQLQESQQKESEILSKIAKQNERIAAVGSSQFLTGVEARISKEGIASSVAAKKRDSSIRQSASVASVTMGPGRLEDLSLAAKSEQSEISERIRRIAEQTASANKQFASDPEKRESVLSGLLKKRSEEELKLEGASADVAKYTLAAQKQRETIGDISDTRVRRGMDLYRFKDPSVNPDELRLKQEKDIAKSFQINNQRMAKEDEANRLQKQYEDQKKAGMDETAKEMKDLADSIAAAKNAAGDLAVEFLSLKDTVDDQAKALGELTAGTGGGGGYIKKGAYAIGKGIDLAADTLKSFYIDRPMADRQNLATRANMEARKIGLMYAATQGDMEAAIAAGGIKSAESFGADIGEKGKYYYGAKIAAEGIRAVGDVAQLGYDTYSGAKRGMAISGITGGGPLVGAVTGAAKGALDSSGGLDTTAEALQKYAMYGANVEQLQLAAEQSQMTVNQAIAGVFGPMLNKAKDFYYGAMDVTAKMGDVGGKTFSQVTDRKFVENAARNLLIKPSEIPQLLDVMRYSGAHTFESGEFLQKARRFEQAGLGTPMDFGMLSASLAPGSKSPSNAVESLAKAVLSGSAAGVKAGLAEAEFKELTEGIVHLTDELSAYGQDVRESIGQAYGLAMGYGTEKDRREALTRIADISGDMDRRPQDPYSEAYRFASYYNSGMKYGFSYSQLGMAENIPQKVVNEAMTILSKAKNMEGAAPAIEMLSQYIPGSKQQLQQLYEQGDLSNFLSEAIYKGRFAGRAGGLAGQLGAQESLGALQGAVRSALKGGRGKDILDAIKENFASGAGGSEAIQSILDAAGANMSPDQVNLIQGALTKGGKIPVTPVSMAAEIAMMAPELIGDLKQLPNFETALRKKRKEVEAGGELDYMAPGLDMGIQGMLNQLIDKLAKGLGAQIDESVSKILQSAADKDVVIQNPTNVTINQGGAGKAPASPPKGKTQSLRDRKMTEESKYEDWLNSL
jgi:hypothetical protein